MSGAPRVTVVGGGIAGLSAALRLAERGYPVKVYERNEWLGGDLGSRAVAGTHLDVYPHMYLNWYHNLWSLIADATGEAPRSGFIPCSTVWQLRQGDYPRFRGIRDAYSPWKPRRVLGNIASGVVPPADMLVYGYSSIDLLGARLPGTIALEELSVSAFLRSRPYMTEAAADAYDSFITMVWSLPSYLTSVADYQTYLGHCVAAPTPPFWLSRGSAQERVIGPVREALARAGAEIITGVRALGVACPAGRAHRLTLRHTRYDEGLGAFTDEGEEWQEDVDELILAVNAPELSGLVRSGPPGERIIEFMPQASQLSRLQELPIPIMHVYFNRRLPGIPAEPVGLFRSSLALAFTDISQTWPGMGENTVLALSCSDPHGLPRTGWEADAMTMLGQLADYLRFPAPAGWGTPGPIDWARTRYDSNANAQLFVNQIGTDSWRPEVRCEELANVCFAGDFCHNRVGMTTIESAVTAGVEAAEAIVQRHGIGSPVQVHEPRELPDALYDLLRVAWAPYAVGGKTWSAGTDAVRTVSRRLGAVLR
ncbi:MAG TPA: FAD-dependent oxidoreductase [Solirubrobacteraceae bacterium]|nr:FAD-dependent oxidoreductase [Solirubrobacteraceae bacterium]